MMWIDPKDVLVELPDLDDCKGEEEKKISRVCDLGNELHGETGTLDRSERGEVECLASAWVSVSVLKSLKHFQERKISILIKIAGSSRAMIPASC